MGWRGNYLITPTPEKSALEWERDHGLIGGNGHQVAMTLLGFVLQAPDGKEQEVMPGQWCRS